MPNASICCESPVSKMTPAVLLVTCLDMTLHKFSYFSSARMLYFSLIQNFNRNISISLLLIEIIFLGIRTPRNLHIT